MLKQPGILHMCQVCAGVAGVKYFLIFHCRFYKLVFGKDHPGSATNVNYRSSQIQGVFFNGTPPKSSKYKKSISARLGVSRLIYVNVDSPNLDLTYFNFFFLGGGQMSVENQ